MDAQELRNLQEAYLEVYQELDEEAPKRIRRPSTNPKVMPYAGPARLHNPKKVKEQADLYDIILSHLLDEGYAETPEAAEVIMVNMSEDWMQSIVESGENIGPEPKTVGGRERPGVPGETWEQRRKRMLPKKKV